MGINDIWEIYKIYFSIMLLLNTVDNGKRVDVFVVKVVSSDSVACQL